MRIRSRLVALLVAPIICTPGLAYAQMPELPADTPGVSAEAPVPLAGDARSGPTTDPAVAPQAGSAIELPETGVNTIVLLLAGAMVTLAGVGLRLRTADAEQH